MEENTTRKRIGADLRAIREAKGLSTRELAEKAELVHSHIVRIESGKYGFTIDTLQRICEVLNITIKLESNG